MNMSDETRARVNQWAGECLAYWSQFNPADRVTEEMVNNQPHPPKDIMFDAAAAISHALACLVHRARTGEVTTQPSIESRLLTSELLDKAIEQGLSGMDPTERRAEAHRMWGVLMSGGDEL